MPDGSAARAREVEETLKAIRGVRQARVEFEDGEPASVKILVLPEKSSSEAISEARRALVQNGFQIDDSRIEVLRSGMGDHQQRRRKLSSIATERSGESFKARVALELEGDVLVGESMSPTERQSEYRSVAAATIESLRILLSQPVDLESVDTFRLGDSRLAIVTLRQQSKTLVGSAIVRLDEHDAIARATLDALNRSLSAPKHKEALKLVR